MLHDKTSLNKFKIFVACKVCFQGLPQWLSGKETACNAEAAGDAVPGWKRSSGGGYGNPLQCSCLENPMDRGEWRATVHRVAKSWT